MNLLIYLETGMRNWGGWSDKPVRRFLDAYLTSSGDEDIIDKCPSRICYLSWY